jgi:prefoldin subunit 4
MATRKADLPKQVDIEILWEDQERINAFGKLSAKKTDLEAHVARLSEQTKNLEDASAEAELAEEEEGAVL